MQQPKSFLRSLFDKGDGSGSHQTPPRLESPCRADDLLDAHEVFGELPRPTGQMGLLLEQLRRSARDGGSGVIAIHGMAGVGKTALLKLYMKGSSWRVAGYDVVIPLRASNGSSLNDIQNAIAGCLGIQRLDDKSHKQRAATISKALRKKKFLLLLDELWEPVDLKAMGVPVSSGKPGGCVILTTRIVDICEQMGAEKIGIDCLPCEEAWNLFVEKAGEELIYSHPDIHSNAEELAWMCGGVPGALVRGGHSMAASSNPEEFNLPWHSPATEETFLHQLKLSYDHLGSDEMRACFLDCVLFPGNHYFPVDWLVDYWVAEDISFCKDFAHGSAYRVVEILNSASLLEVKQPESKRYVKMHPLIHRLAMWIASERGEKNKKWIVRPSAGLIEAPEAGDWREAEKISLFDNKITELPQSPECPNLVMLLLRENSCLERIPNDFFRQMPRLTVLDLSDASIEQLPAGIGDLCQLRYLSLYNTKITSLPKELGQLEKLRVLNLAMTPNLRAIPNGLFRRLHALRVLRMYMSYGYWTAASIYARGLDIYSGGRLELEELKTLTKLRTVGITAETLEAFRQIGIQCYPIETLHVRGCPGLTRIGLQETGFCIDMYRLRWLMITESTDLSEIVLECPPDPFQPPHYTTDQWPPPPPFPALELLYLVDLENTRIVYEGGSIGNLVSLHIAYCYGMEHLVYMTSKGNSESNGQAIVPFPKLRELHLSHLPKMESLISDGNIQIQFNCLQLLVVEECPNLKKLSVFRPSRDIEVRGSQTWWDGLEYNDIDSSSFVELQ